MTEIIILVKVTMIQIICIKLHFVSDKIGVQGPILEIV
jgi:hypothetical protein